ncbi:MAG: hypothetical protein KDA25_10105 [Phycisphaerales bacterium]|nr:hypothetical protein [Phycisphaerales bacterium]
MFRLFGGIMGLYLGVRLASHLAVGWGLLLVPVGLVLGAFAGQCVGGVLVLLAEGVTRLRSTEWLRERIRSHMTDPGISTAFMELSRRRELTRRELEVLADSLRSDSVEARANARAVLLILARRRSGEEDFAWGPDGPTVDSIHALLDAAGRETPR